MYDTDLLHSSQLMYVSLHYLGFNINKISAWEKKKTTGSVSEYNNCLFEQCYTGARSGCVRGDNTIMQLD